MIGVILCLAGGSHDDSHQGGLGEVDSEMDSSASRQLLTGGVIGTDILVFDQA